MQKCFKMIYLKNYVKKNSTDQLQIVFLYVPQFKPAFNHKL